MVLTVTLIAAVVAILIILLVCRRKIAKVLKSNSELSAELETARHDAEAASRSKSLFLSSMSHELLTPMNVILGYTDMASASADDPERVKDCLEKVHVSSEHLLDLVNGVLDMSCIESGEETVDEHPENLAEMVDMLAELARPGADAHKHVLTVSRESLGHPFVICDRFRVNKVLLNVLSNAINYTPDGGKVRLTASGTEYSEGKGHYVFCIADNGIGMSKEFMETMYTPFNRAQTSTESRIHGTGLGMSITKALVEMMGGTIAVQSEPGHGTVVTIAFDFKQYEPAAAPDASLAEGFDFNGLKILLVEDNELNSEIAKVVLESNGMTVETVSDGKQAVDRIQSASKGEIDLILMDIQMPEMDGYEATGRIRAMGAPLSDVPIIAMTANAFEEDRREAFKAGMNEHLGKPFNVENLKGAIAKVLKS